MNPSWTVLDRDLKFCKYLDPQCQNTIGLLEGTQPFQAMMVGSQNDMQQIMHEVLKGAIIANSSLRVEQ